MVGGLLTVQLLPLLAVPSAGVTLLWPLVAPDGTVAVIAVAEFTVKLALVPLNRTAVAPVKLVPLIVTVAPTPPLVGEKQFGRAACREGKLLAVVAVPAEVVTRRGPVM